ncbi:hypothetical protein [Acetobacter oeni]|uniref:Uncharacterized protein n=1 Tax=Acetobacter oeni TaxID=304077 RepID=A0A511XP23_9PROT|nr:hypothetical protein [Acetobacter oeni]MBB3884502.1 hypothetical protein [Acetobacter oeni]NHO20434.1 hypothetical protein [Acetobacter oeni]GBR00573.1 hypothetical protein AA21952_0148 [Acetobacter oeni LMG 21952]GEN64687.1 hypothetical protein AOE01nite_29110 [Acetobacter oeni]
MSETTSSVTRPEFENLSGTVRHIDREVAVLRGEVQSTKADMQDLKDGQKEIVAEFRKSQTFRGIITGGWAGLGTGAVLGLAKIMGFTP